MALTVVNGANRGAGGLTAGNRLTNCRDSFTTSHLLTILMHGTGARTAAKAGQCWCSRRRLDRVFRRFRCDSAALLLWNPLQLAPHCWLFLKALQQADVFFSRCSLLCDVICVLSRCSHDSVRWVEARHANNHHWIASGRLSARNIRAKISHRSSWTLHWDFVVFCSVAPRTFSHSGAATSVRLYAWHV